MLAGAMLRRMMRARGEELVGVVNRAALSARGGEVLEVADCATAVVRSEHVVRVVLGRASSTRLRSSRGCRTAF
jgi:hypothetical protein